MPIGSEEGLKQDAEGITTRTTETPISIAPIPPVIDDEIADNSSETKQDSTRKPEDAPALVCCACCAACALYVVCLPCEIAGFIVRCLVLPFQCAILYCCPPHEKPPAPESESTA